MEPNSQNIITQEPSFNSNKRLNLLPTVIVGILMLFLGFSGSYLLLANKSDIKEPVTEGSQALQTLKPSPISTKDNIDQSSNITEWRVAKAIAPLNFEYPYGWHVASQWPDKWENGVAIWIDTEPISGAPRGGPFAKIEINWKNGMQNAEEVFNKTKEDIRKNTENVKEEIIKSSIGDIYHFTGVLPEGYMGGAVVDEYVLFINSSDNINDAIITINTLDKPELKDILKHIVLSMTKPQ